MEPPKNVYGSLRPQTAPAGARKKVQQQADDELTRTTAGTDFQDPRHQDGTPVPWLRYFFPRDFDAREGNNENPFFQFFDVKTEPLEEDIAVLPPAWSPNAFFRLSFTQQTLGVDQDIISRMPSEESPLDAVDFTKKTWPIYADGAEKHLEDVLAFCRSVATFQARTWKDAFPLVDLLRGLLLYMIDQTMKGQKIFEERARRNHAEALKAESERMAAEYAARLEEEKRLWQLQLEERIAATMVETRARVSEEMARDINEMKSEIEQWTTKCAVAELHAKKLHDQIAGLQRQIEAFQTQIEVDKAAHSRALNDKGNEIRSLVDRERKLTDALSNTRKVISDALKAKTKKEIMDVATAAITATLPGSNAYVAELRSVGALSPTQAQTALAEVQQLALADPTSIFGQGLKALGMEFLTSPAAPGPMSETAASARPSSARPTSGRSGTHEASIPPPNLEEIKGSLAFRYIAASEKQQFMIDQSMKWGQGVSWPLLDGAREVNVPDVEVREGVHFFKNKPTSGSYFAVPIIGAAGELMGMLGVDTTGMDAGAQGGGLGGVVEAIGYQEQSFIREMAGLINAAVVRDQAALEQLSVQAALLNEVAEPDEEVMFDVPDPDKFADLKGGLKLFKEALQMLRGMSDEDLESFKGLDTLDDTTMAVLRSILSAAGERSTGEWADIKGLITRNLVDKLAAMDPNDAWAEWKDLCKHLQSVAAAEAEYGRVDALVADPNAESGQGLRSQAFGRALGNWMMAVRKISAGIAFQKDLEKKLAKNNANLLKLFHGDGSSSLTELKSYRIPPKITFTVLQCILMLGGNTEEDCHGWGKMKTLCNYKLIKKIVELKPKSTDPATVKKCVKVVKNIDEDDVKKESSATLALFRWMANFVKVSDLHHAAA